MPTESHNAMTRADQLMYARQREWSGVFRFDRLKLRNLIAEELASYAGQEHRASVQVAVLQAKYNRLATALRALGHDPVAIANGKVEIGERVVVPSDCPLCGLPVTSHNGYPAGPEGILICPKVGERVEVEG